MPAAASQGKGLGLKTLFWKSAIGIDKWQLPVRIPMLEMLSANTRAAAATMPDADILFPIADASWLHRLLQHLPDPVWLKDQHGVYQYCNQAFANMFGWGAADIIGKRDGDLVDHDLADFFRARDLLAMHHGRALVNDEWITFAHDGHRRLLQVIKTPLYSGRQLVGVLGIGRDITDLHSVQQQLAERERTLRYVMQATGEGVWDWDIASGILQHNCRWSEITGIAIGREAHPLDEFVGRVHAQDLPAVQSLLDSCQRGEAPYYSEYRICRDDGRTVWVMDRGDVVERNPHGLPKRMVGSLSDITIRKQAEQALRASEARFRAIFENVDALAIQGYAPDGTVLYWNHAASLLYGYSPQEALGRSLYELIIPPPARELVRQDVRWMFEHQQGVPAAHLRLLHKDGHLVDVHSSHTVVNTGDQLMLFCLDIDMSAQLRAESALQESEQRYRALFAASADAILVLHGDVVVDINPVAARLFGCEVSQLLQRTPCELSPPLQPDGHDSQALASHYLQKTLEQGLWQCEWRFMRPDGSQFDAELQLTVVELGAERHILATCRDITQKKKDAALIWQQANFDQLTGLPNRYMLQNRLAQEVAHYQRDGDQLALLLLDLDHFKEVNDTLGHRAGDQLLQLAAHRLQACVRHVDSVARLGGDEFTVIISRLDHAQQAGELAERILQELGAPYQLGDDVVYVSTSIGITIFPDDCQELEALLKNADQAMYAAKAQGRNRSCFFTPSMQQAAQARVRLGKDLRQALAEQQFEVYYQPVLALDGGHISGAEALLRWQHPERGWISPAEFIPLAEDSGLIVALGDWVCQQVCQQLQHWRQLRPQLRISVNVSPIQFFADDGRLQHWPALLARHGLPGDSLVLEITERLLLDNREQVSTQLAALRAFGIRVSLDDFGTGYSSLSYLKKFAIDYLKIDQSFVRHLEADDSDRALCEAIIVMAHRLGMCVVAEGIEQPAHLQWLQAAGCDFGQGYLFAAAIPAAQFEQLLLAEDTMPRHG